MSVLQDIISPRNETTTLSRPAQWLIDIIGGTETLSGERVNSATAFGIIAYFACIRNISEDVGKLPRHLFKRKERGKEKILTDPRYALVHDAPNPEMSAMTFHETLTSHCLGFRGGYAEIVRDGRGVPIELWPLDPSTVDERRDASGRLFYLVLVDGQATIVQPMNMLHIHGLGYDGITQYVLYCIARESIGSIIAARNFGSSFFGRGATTTGLLEVPAGFSDKALENLRKSWKERHEGDASKAHKTVLLEAGVTYKPTSTEPEKSQMLETLEFNVEEIARLFRMPPQKIGHLARAVGWSTVEQFNIDYVTDTLMPWLTRWEQEYKRKLFLPRESDLFVEHSVEGLLRGDSEKRAAFYDKMFQLGVMSSNDIRDKENLNPRKDGDVYYVSNNVQTAENSLIAPESPEEPDTPETGPETEPEPSSRPENGLKIALALSRDHEAMLAKELTSVLKFEASKVKKLAPQALKDFYAEQDKYVVDAVSTPVCAFVNAFFIALTGELPDDEVETQVLAHTKAIAKRHVQKSLTCGEIEPVVRATAVASDEMARLVELVVWKLTKGTKCSI